jgi:hypothetical protein
MKTIKTSELTGAALDWAVAKCEGDDVAELSEGGSYMVVPGATYWNEEGEGFPVEYSPSTSWAQGGPIIEREHISIESTRVGGLGDRWMASAMYEYCTEFSDKPLIAAMRCYVASKLGDNVEIPEELL